MPAAFQGRVIGKYDFPCLIDDKGFTARHKKLARHAECIQHLVGAITEQGVGETVIGLKLFMALYRAAIDADHNSAGLDQVAILVAEAAGFFGTYHAFIFRIKENYQAVFADMVVAIEPIPVLVFQLEGRDGIADGQFFVLAAILAGGDKGEEEHMGAYK